MREQPIRALLVEDNPGDVRLLQEALRDARAEGIELTHVGLLEEAHARLARGGFDVVLLDLSLPDGHGLETVSRTVGAAPTIPIVVLTGLADEGAAFQALREGAQDYLVKGQGDGILVSRAVRYAIERKRAEIEHQRLETQLQHAQRLESLGVLAGGIAHDFNNLLTIITCNAQLLRQTIEAGPAQVTAIRDIETAAAHATEMTRSLLAFSRPTKPQVRPVDVNLLGAEIHGFLRRVLPATIDFRIDLDPQPATIGVDPGQMQQVLINLCVNARDAMPAGGIMEMQTRRLSRNQLPPHVKLPGGAQESIRISVSDNGSGMDPETLRQIFDPFFTTKPKDRGTGLGLAIVYKIVEVHKGTIDVSSKPDEGTRFDIYFPAVEVAPDTAPPAPAVGGKERILILDDEEMIASLMKTLLESRGYRTIVANRPEEAIEIVRRDGGDLDLAIVDFYMPNMTGDTCLAEIRQMRPQLHAILITGDVAAISDKTDPQTRILCKPFTATSLTDKVRELLELRKQAVVPA